MEQMEQQSRRFRVRFRSFEGMRTDGSYSSPELKGVGEIAFLGGTIRLSGRLDEYFGLGRRYEIALQPRQVTDVEREGRAVRFRITEPSELELELELVEFLATDEQCARIVVGLLPGTMTEAQARKVADVKDFDDRLQSVGGKTWVTTALAAANVAVFLGAAAAGAGLLIPDVDAMTRAGTNYGPLTLHGQWWRLFTSMFLHFGLVHLGFNMWALVDGGRLAERLYGSATFLIIYVTAGLCGSLSSLLWNPAVNSAGASGAIFGVYGAMLAYFLRRDTLVPASVMLSKRYSMLVFIGFNLFYGIGHRGIDNAAHIGGLLGGFALGLALATPLSAEERTGSQSAVYLRALVLAIALVGGLVVAVLRVRSLPGIE
jgi:rhomboid protease GluP